MLTFTCYLLKVIACSGILYGYYLLTLRNKIFHQWNRFYLLAAIILSSVTPLIKINIFTNGPTSDIRVAQLLRVVSAGDEIAFDYSKNTGSYRPDASGLFVFIYVSGGVLLSLLLIRTLVIINRLKTNNRQTNIEGINFLSTNAKGTPFSFFNTIFWNEEIDINTLTGKQIFRHEVAHVREKHSYDKFFLNILLIFYWCNPFFWLVRRELNMIHEFIADQQALDDNDTAAFAAMILAATYPRQRFTITNNFFYSPLKRRLIMLNKNKNTTVRYATRLLVLPLAALVFFAFTLKMRPGSSAPARTDKKITVVIDAGHGGDDAGAKGENGVYEKDITLSIAKKIRSLNNNENVNIILSREHDETISVRDRTDAARSLHADLFISIHLNAETVKNANSGCNVLIPNNDNIYLKESKILGADINEAFKKNYQLPVANDLSQREKGVWILKANSCASVIVQVGFISNKSDLLYITGDQNQQTVARNILNGIEKYTKENAWNNSKDR